MPHGELDSLWCKSYLAWACGLNGAGWWKVWLKLGPQNIQYKTVLIWQSILFAVPTNTHCSNSGWTTVPKSHLRPVRHQHTGPVPQHLSICTPRWHCCSVPTEVMTDNKRYSLIWINHKTLITRPSSSLRPSTSTDNALLRDSHSSSTDASFAFTYTHHLCTEQNSETILHAGSHYNQCLKQTVVIRKVCCWHQDMPYDYTNWFRVNSWALWLASSSGC